MTDLYAASAASVLVVVVTVYILPPTGVSVVVNQLGPMVAELRLAAVMSAKRSSLTFSRRSWARFVARTRLLSAADFFKALAKSGTMAAKMMPAITMVTKSSTILKPRASRLARIDVFIASRSFPPAGEPVYTRTPGPRLLRTVRIEAPKKEPSRRP